MEKHFHRTSVPKNEANSDLDNEICERNGQDKKELL